MIKPIITMIAITMLSNPFFLKYELSFTDMTVEQRAEECGLSTEEFILLSSVVEAESDRCTDSTEGRRYIALVILNRVADERFPDTISEVLTAPGQFSTVRNGQSITERTDLSDQAVMETIQWINSGEEYPWVLFFNCRSYNIGTAYAQIGGNYFMTMTPMTEGEEK